MNACTPHCLKQHVAAGRQTVLKNKCKWIFMIDCTKNLVQLVGLTLNAMDMRQFVSLYVYL